MKKIVVYTMKYCPYCESAKRLIQQKGWVYEEIMLNDDDDAAWKKLEKQTGFKTMPQIFIGDQFVGGYSELSRLNQQGKLDALVE